MTRRTAGSNCRGFTLIELLVVIGIIVILIGLLLPMISKIRKSAYTADTQNEISQLSNACTQYYQDFKAYPGPFANQDIENTQGTSPTLFTIDLYNPTAAAYTNGKQIALTGTENLVVGLLGGVNFNPNNGNALAFKPNEVGLGPMNLSLLNPRRYSPYLQASSGSTNLLSTYTGLSYQDPTNGQFANDGFIPEFVDRYPSPLPLLYMRARTGARGVISGQSPSLTNPITGTIYASVPAIQDPFLLASGATDPTAHYQYDLGEILGFTNSYIGAPNTKGNTSGTHGLRRVGVTSSPPPALQPEPISNDAFQILANSQIAPTNISSQQYIDATSKPKAVDQFIIISAGPDGIYGTQDDITSFGSISQQ